MVVPVTFRFLSDLKPRSLLTAVSLENIDQEVFSQAFPFEEKNPIIEPCGPGLSLWQMTRTLLETNILVVTTQHPERKRHLLEDLSKSAQNAHLKLLFTPRKAAVHGYTNQVCYNEKFGPLSDQFGHFVGLVVSAEHKGSFICMSNKDLVEVCKASDSLHYRFFP